jgi:hypothetical protein
MPYSTHPVDSVTFYSSELPRQTTFLASGFIPLAGFSVICPAFIFQNTALMGFVAFKAFTACGLVSISGSILSYRSHKTKSLSDFKGFFPAGSCPP